mmetsp:Transcript_47906/g.134867  ORF Transcript_47906/g.134867 Transcript_47906/m.134867 type:complete len:119 (-) Transcript_47906:111-467(-)
MGYSGTISGEFLERWVAPDERKGAVRLQVWDAAEKRVGEHHFPPDTSRRDLLPRRTPTGRSLVWDATETKLGPGHFAPRASMPSSRRRGSSRHGECDDGHQRAPAVPTWRHFGSPIAA